MKFKLNQNLGFEDARLCNSQFDAGLAIDASELAAGRTVDLPEAAAEFLSKKYPALLEPGNGSKPVRGVAAEPKVKGVNDQA